MKRETLEHVVTTGELCGKKERQRKRREDWLFVMAWRGVTTSIDTLEILVCQSMIVHTSRQGSWWWWWFKVLYSSNISPSVSIQRSPYMMLSAPEAVLFDCLTTTHISSTLIINSSSMMWVQHMSEKWCTVSLAVPLYWELDCSGTCTRNATPFSSFFFYTKWGL